MQRLFQSTLPCRKRPRMENRLSGQKNNFNPLFRVGRDDTVKAPWINILQFQSTLPCRKRRFPVCIFKLGSINFNPLFRVGRDRKINQSSSLLIGQFASICIYNIVCNIKNIIMDTLFHPKIKLLSVVMRRIIVPTYGRSNAD